MELAPLISTRIIGWPVELNIYRIGEDVYFDITAALKTLGLHKHVKKHGFSSIDKLLSENGIQNSFVLNKNQRNRDLIRYAAFVILAIRHQGTDSSMEPLRKHLLSPILLPPTGLIATEACSSTTVVHLQTATPVQIPPVTAPGPVTPARIHPQTPAVRTLEPRTADEAPPVERPNVATPVRPEPATPTPAPPVTPSQPVTPVSIQLQTSAVRTLEPRTADEALPVERPIVATPVRPEPATPTPASPVTPSQPVTPVRIQPQTSAARTLDIYGYIHFFHNVAYIKLYE